MKIGQLHRFLANAPLFVRPIRLVNETPGHPVKWILSGSWTSPGSYNGRCNFHTYCPIMYMAILANVRISLGHGRLVGAGHFYRFIKQLHAASQPRANYWRTLFRSTMVRVCKYNSVGGGWEWLGGVGCSGHFAPQITVNVGNTSHDLTCVLPAVGSSPAGHKDLARRTAYYFSPELRSCVMSCSGPFPSEAS